MTCESLRLEKVFLCLYSTSYSPQESGSLCFVVLRRPHYSQSAEPLGHNISLEVTKLDKSILRFMPLSIRLSLST